MMLNGIDSGLHQGLELRIFTGVTGVIIVIILSTMDPIIRVFRGIDQPMQGFHSFLVLNSIRSQTLISLLPVFSVLPFSASFLEDIKTKYVRFFLMRSSYRIYLLSRIIVCFFCGGLVAAAGVLTSWGIAALVFIPKELALEEPPEVYLDMLKTICLLYLNGGLWAVIGLAFSTLMESKYIAYTSPFVLYYLLVILYERYFPEWFLIYPMEWVNPSNLWPLGHWGPAILMLELTALFSMLFIWRGGRRIRDL